MHAPVNPFLKRITVAHRLESASVWLFRLGTYFVLVCASYIFMDIGWNGSKTLLRPAFPFVNVPFLTESPETLHLIEANGQKYELGDRAFRRFLDEHPGIELQKHETVAYSAGGIFPCIIGTILLVIGSMAIALLLGVFSAIFLSEYSRSGPVINFIRLAIMNLSGVPSIVFGMFGYGMFVIFFGWKVSLMAGWFTLAFMVLPVIITASEESLRAVPQGFREGSLALGATKWQTIWQNVLPYALPGILTSSVLGVARVAGETAPIMFTAAYVVRDQMPWQVAKFSDFFFQGVMALPYHIFVVSARVPQNEYTEKVQYAASLVFLIIVMSFALISILLRNKMRSRYKW